MQIKLMALTGALLAGCSAWAAVPVGVYTNSVAGGSDARTVYFLPDGRCGFRGRSDGMIANYKCEKVMDKDCVVLRTPKGEATIVLERLDANNMLKGILSAEGEIEDEDDYSPIPKSVQPLVTLTLKTTELSSNDCAFVERAFKNGKTAFDTRER